MINLGRQYVLFPAIVAVGALLVTAWFRPNLSDESLTYEEVAKALSQQRPGFGLETNGSGPVDQAMAYGLIASASAIAGDVPRATAAADWLVENARTSTNSVGWGLGWAWDAFHDGSVNPSDTVYGITTAIAIEGLLRTYVETGVETYLATALEAVDYYKDFRTETAAGAFFWYSDQKVDATNVHNVSAMLANAFARAADVSKRKDLRQIAREALTELMSHTRDAGDHVTWDYWDRRNSPLPNDLVHAAYIAYGALSADRLTGAGVVDARKAAEYIIGFQQGDQVMRFRPEEARSVTQTLQARAWGIGMAAFVLNELGHRTEAANFLRFAVAYRLPDGDFSYELDGSQPVPRSTAHLLLGAAALSGHAEQR